LISNTSASVFVEHLQHSEVADIASLVAKIGARLDMVPNDKTASVDVDVKLVNVNSNSALAGLVLLAAKLSHKSPSAVLEETKKLISDTGFDVES